jgi:hypothetical protein
MDLLMFETYESFKDNEVNDWFIKIIKKFLKIINKNILKALIEDLLFDFKSIV